MFQFAHKAVLAIIFKNLIRFIPLLGSYQKMLNDTNGWGLSKVVALTEYKCIVS